MRMTTKLQGELEARARERTEAPAAHSIQNEDLKCKDCKHRKCRIPDVGFVERSGCCGKFPFPGHKPGSVLDGGDCEEYEHD